VTGVAIESGAEAAFAEGLAAVFQVSREEDSGNWCVGGPRGPEKEKDQ